MGRIKSLFVVTLMTAATVFAGPARTTYQARIVKPDGYPLEAASVNFRFTILDPSATCVLYVEDYTAVNMVDSGGLISFSLGSGVRSFPSSGPAATFSAVFDNAVTSFSCQSPGIFSPVANDIRKIAMQFNDGNGWQTLPAMTINAVPYAMYAGKSENAIQLNGKSDTAFVEYATLAGLNCQSNEAIKFNGVSFGCIATSSATTVTSGTVITALGYTPADGAIVTTISSNVSAVSSSVFSVSSTVSSLAGTVSSLQSSVAASFAAITSSQWTTSGTNIFYNTGNVGIGTANPGEILDATGNIKASGSLIGANVRAATIYGSNVATGSLNIDSTSDSTKGDINIGAVNGNRVGIGGAANANTAVMIRRNNATYPLLINGATNTENVRFGVIAGTNYYGGMDFMNDGLQARWRVLKNGAAESGSNAGSDFNVDRFNDSGTNLGTAFSILRSSGNVGIGTTTPITKLDVSGGVRIGAESTTCAPALAGTLRYNASNVEYCNGTSWQAFGVSGAGITNFNGSTSGTQSLATGTGGTAPNIVTANGVHTLNIPLASTGSVTAGLLSNTDYTAFSNKITSSAASIAQVLGYVPADNSVSGTYAQKASNLSDLTNVATARTNLGLGTFATASTIDLGGASATGTLAIARLPSFTGDATIAAASNTIVLANSGVTAGTYTKVTVDGKGRVTSGTQLTSSDVTAALGYTPSQSTSSTQWTTSGTAIYYNTGNVGIGTANPATALDVLGIISSRSSSTWGSGANSMFKAVDQNGLLFSLGLDSGNSKLELNTQYSTMPIVFSVANFEKMRVTSNGYVGIGSTAPANALHVIGKGTSANSLLGSMSNAAVVIQPNTATLWSVGFGVVTGASYTQYLQAGNPAGTLAKNFAINPFGGNVGIGIPEPQAKLHLTSGTAAANTAPLKFTSGTLLTTTEAGAFEYDGFNFYVTDSTNIRRTIATGSSAGTIDNASNINSSSNITMTPNGGSVIVSATTASTNSSTGALIVNGGLGVAGNINSGGTIQGVSVTATSGMISPYIAGSINASGNLTLDSTTHATKGNILLAPNGGIVGIGTTAPAAKFSVKGTRQSSITPTNSIMQVGGDDVFLYMGAGNGVGNPYPIMLQSMRDADSVVFPLVLNPNGGNVGIGTMSPSSPLSVSGAIRSDSTAANWSFIGNAGGNNFQVYHPSAGGVRLFNSGGDIVMGVTNTGSVIGNVGIGTSAPTSSLQVNGSGIIVDSGTSASYGSGIKFNNTGYKHYSVGVKANNFIIAETSTVGTQVWPASPTERLVIDGSGNVGIGTSPAYNLDVYAAASAAVLVRSSGNTGGSLYLGNSNHGLTRGPGGANLAFTPGSNEVTLFNTSGNLYLANGSGSGNSTARVTVDTSGNVGIGTTTPTYPLHVVGSIRSTNSIGNLEVGVRGQQMEIGDASLTTLRFDSNSYRIWNSTAAEIARFTASGSFGIGTTSPAAKFEVSNSSTPVMRVLAGTGNGVDDDNLLRLMPQNGTGEGGHLEFKGSASNQDWTIDTVAGELRIFEPGQSRNAVKTRGGITFTINKSTTSTPDTLDALKILSSGNVGVGTTPLTKFEVYGNISSKGGEIIMQRPVTAGGWARGLHYTPDGSVNVTADGLAGIGLLGTNTTQSSIYLAFGAAPWASNNGMHILPTGNVGIRTTAPQTELHVKGSIIRLEGTARTWDFAADPSPDSLQIRNITAGTFPFTILAGGNIGVGTTAPSERLHVVGNLRVQGSTDCTLGNGAGGTNCSSDARLKENIKPIPYALEKINSLKGVEFDWNEKSLSHGRHDIGVIAQDVEKVFPTAVMNDKNTGYKKVDYAVLVAPVIQAIKEFYAFVVNRFDKYDRQIASKAESAEVQTLKTKTEKLEAENLQLKQQNETIKAYLCQQNPSAPFCK